MCTGSGSSLNIFGDKNPLGKLNRQIDPGSAALWNKDAKQLDSLHLLKYIKPDIPDPPGTPNQRSSWKLVDEAGMRGARRGGAQVSELHCNFLLNVGEATAADIEGLGEDVRAAVKAKSGVELRWEIKRIGRPAVDATVEGYLAKDA